MPPTLAKDVGMKKGSKDSEAIGNFMGPNWTHRSPSIFALPFLPFLPASHEALAFTAVTQQTECVRQFGQVSVQ